MMEEQTVKCKLLLADDRKLSEDTGWYLYTLSSM